jgi:hypothetical protein
VFLVALAVFVLLLAWLLPRLWRGTRRILGRPGAGNRSAGRAIGG